MVGNHHSHPFTTALPLISINSTSKTSYSCLKKNGPTMFSRWLFRVPGIYQVIWKARKSHVFDVFWARGSHHRAAFWCNFVAVRVFFGFQRCCTSFDIWDSGQIRIFHQPREIPEIRRFPLLFTTIWGEVVWGRYNLTRWDVLAAGSLPVACDQE